MCLESQKTLKSGSTNQVRLNTIIAGQDPVAVDHVCTRIIGANPEDIAHITMAAKIGLGTNDPDSISILGENIATKYTYRFDRGTTVHATYGQGNRVWLVSKAFPYTSMTNQYIANEASLAPSKGDANWSAPIYFLDDRIDLASYQNPSGSVVTYCYTNVYSPKATTGSELWLNSEEQMMVYLNGVQVYNYNGIARPNGNLVTDKPLVNLKEGDNTLLVKVQQTTGCYDFALNICEPGTKGNRVSGLKFYIKNYNVPAALKSSTKLFNIAATEKLHILISSDQLTIQNEEVVNVVLYNLNGKKIAETLENTLNISSLNSGVYLISAKFRNGTLITNKFIKK